MSDAAPAVDFERLLAHREWVRSVARSLAFDAATADDLEQEAWLEALRAPPRNTRNLRGWLTRVVQNRARKRARSGARRSDHESRAARTAISPSASDVVGEAEAQQRIVQAVLELDEPYRTTVLLRFYEGLPPREVGARMDVPAETVRTRVRRAGAHLRTSLGGEGLFGWTAAVLPLLGQVESSASTSSMVGGALALEKKAYGVVAVVGLVLGGGAAFLASGPLDDGAPAKQRRFVAERPTEAADGAGSTSTRTHVRRPPPQPRDAAPDVAPRSTPSAPPSIEPDRPPIHDAPPPPVLNPVEELSLPDDQDAQKLAEARAQVREKYESEKRGGFTTHDLAYWVDVRKLDDSRWKKHEIEHVRHDRGLQLHARWSNETSASSGMWIDVLVLKLPHWEAQGGETTHFSYPFDNVGEAVKNTDVEGLASGFFEDWCRGTKDVVDDESTKPTKSRLKIPKFEAAATGTDAESNTRTRRHWYVWADGKQRSTYVVEIRYGPAVVEREGLVAKGPEFVKNLKELKDKRVEWPSR